MTERPSDVDSAPFGAMERHDSSSPKPTKSSGTPASGEGDSRKKDWRKERRGKPSSEKGGEGQERRRTRTRKPQVESADKVDKVVKADSDKPSEKHTAARRTKRPARSERPADGKREEETKVAKGKERARESSKAAPLGTTEGLILIDKAHHGSLRATNVGWLKTSHDVHVSPRLVQKYKLSEGSIITGPYARSQGAHKFDLTDVETIDGFPAGKAPKVRPFKQCVSITPDFHYNVGDLSGDLSLRVIDLLCPVGRGTRGLLVAPPRSGKTMILQSFAKAVEEHFPDVKLMVLLVDERPEEATDWKRTINPASVFVSTNDETAKKHTQLCEAVFKRAMRLVELGEEVILLVDSITRMGRAYNNVNGNSGKTMSGGIDSKALEVPKQFFGMARNTESSGSLTILATALIETGSVMDKVIFEEFKGTGNMELVLSRKLADRRIFPAIDIERSGTRKEERLFSSAKLRQMHTLRRVLTSMHFAEAMELLVTKLDDAATNTAFLKRFEVASDA